MKKRTFIRSCFFACLLCLLACAAVQAQAPTYKRLDDPAGLYVSKIIATKNGGILSIFLSPTNGNPRLLAYSSVVQRTDGTGQVLWEKRFDNLALADALEAKNGDLVFSGSEWQGTAFAGSLTAFVLRTESDGSFLWRQEVSFARAAMPDTVFCKEQRLAETTTGKLYFQCRDASAAAGNFVAFYLNTNGSLIWSRRLSFPQGVNFTDMTAAFDNSLLISGSYPAGSFPGSALLCVDTNARLRYIRTFTARSNDFVITQILKDEARKQYYFCGQGATDAQGAHATVMKADADIESLAYAPATAVLPALFRCRNLPKIFGADADGNVYCLYADRGGSSAYRKLVNGDSAYVQFPVCKFDSALQVVWRKRYAVPVDKNSAPFLSSTPQVVLLNGKLVAALQTDGQHTTSAPPTGWLMTTDTAGNSSGCVSTNEPYTTKSMTFVSGGLRANILSAGLPMRSSQVFNSRDFVLASVDTCLGRKLPKSRFTISAVGGGATDTVCTGTELSFYDDSYNEPQRWQWLFPSGADTANADTSCFPDVYNVGFPAPGTYAVKLVTENGAGLDTATKIITVLSQPKPPDLGPDAVICPGDSVVLSYKDEPFSQHAFYAVGGSFYSTADTVVIKTTGTYVCAVVSRCGTATDTIRISAAQKPTAGFTPPLSCGSLTVLFANTTQANGSTTVSYQWDFFDKNNTVLGSSQADNPSFTFPAFDTVKARLIAQSALACTRPDTVEKIFILHPKSAALFAFTERCGDTNVSFSGKASVPVGSITNYAWTFGDGASDNTASPAHNYSAAGSYTVQFTATSDAGCASDAATQTVTVRAKPVAGFTYSNDACEGKAFRLQDRSTVNGTNITGYYWRLPSSGQVYTTVAINPVVAVAGIIKFYYAVTSAQGCTSDTLAKDILVESIPVASLTASNGCLNDSLSFLSTATTAVGSIQSYQWTVSNGLTSAQKAPKFYFPSAGSYTVTHTATSGNGCVSKEAIKTVTVYPLPQPSFTYSLPCLNAPVAFTNTTVNATANTWQWTVNSNLISTRNSPAYSFASPGTYTVGLQTTDGNGCTARSTKTVVIDDFRLQLIAIRNPVLPGEPVWLQTRAGLPYNVTAWSPALLFPSQNNKGQRLATETPVLVQVAAQSVQGCKDSTSLLVDVYVLDDVWVPSGFTPNGDGKNDVLYVVGKGISDVTFTVYNRWGGVVFTSRDRTVGWDGYAGGKPLTSGTYVYTLRAKKADGKMVEKKGTVTLIR